LPNIDIVLAIYASRVTFPPEKSGWPKKKNKIYSSFIVSAF